MLQLFLKIFKINNKEMYSAFLKRLSEYTPKSVICLREGYTSELFWKDLLAGITVGIISLPLTMAFAIASGVSPERGLFTGIVAGFLISLLGGSRVQIGGPTGAFVVIVFSIIERHGYDGLCLATLLAGGMLIILGLIRAGMLLKFISHSVTVGFTAGIALILFSSQIKDLLGLEIERVPVDFLEKWSSYTHTIHTFNPFALLVSFFSLAVILFTKRFAPKIPGAIVAVVLATLLVAFFQLPVETIHSKFGSIPHMLPSPRLPMFSFEKIKVIFPDAVTITLLAAIESLLSAVVADGMSGNRHRSNCELVAQGFANIASALFGGITATGAIARTATNFRMGAKTPMAGMIHAVTILLLMLFFAPLAAKIPLPTLGAILVFVAWNMSEISQIKEILKGPRGDIVVLILSFLLTVLIDITVAVEVGVIVSCLLFFYKMSDKTSIKACHLILAENAEQEPKGDSGLLLRTDIPADVIVFEINGPLFFGSASSLNDELYKLKTSPKAFILQLTSVPFIDASGIYALKLFSKRCKEKKIVFLISGVSEELEPLLRRSGVKKTLGESHFFENLDAALGYAKQIKTSSSRILERPNLPVTSQ